MRLGEALEPSVFLVGKTEMVLVRPRVARNSTKTKKELVC